MEETHTQKKIDIYKENTHPQGKKNRREVRFSKGRVMKKSLQESLLFSSPFLVIPSGSHEDNLTAHMSLMSANVTFSCSLSISFPLLSSLLNSCLWLSSPLWENSPCHICLRCLPMAFWLKNEFFSPFVSSFSV